ncbi:MAG: S8 family serine peptidase [candidate division WOR-3 bacterium]
MLNLIAILLVGRELVPIPTPVKGMKKALPVPTNYFLLHENDPNYWKDATNRVVVGYWEGVDIESKIPGLVAKGAKFFRTSRTGANFVVMELPANDPLTMSNYIHSVLEDPDVLYAEPDMIARVLRVTPNDPMFANQWALAAINIGDAWDWTMGNTTVVIAIIDQGVQYDHPDLAAHFFGYIGYDQVNNDPDPYPTAASEDHGTHCAGVAAAVINNGVGIAGVSNSRLISERVLNSSGSGTYTDIADGIRDAADHGAHILSMSLGGASGSSTLESACTYAWNAGCLLVAAAGNGGADNGIDYPARYSTVMAIGAIGHNDAYPTFSDRGPELELCAPGVNVLSTVYPNAYDSVNWSGTSMATPHVSGVAALVKALNPSLTNSQIRAILDSTATDIWYLGWDDTTGYGKVNPSWALKVADGIKPDPDSLPGGRDYFQSPYYYFQQQYRVEYEATQAVPETACILREIWIAWYNPLTTQRTKNVTYYLWANNVNRPGAVLRSWPVQVTIPAQSGQWVIWDVSAENISFGNGAKFWFGHYEPDTTFPTSLIDIYTTSNNVYSTDGSTWNHDYDYLQFVVVSKPISVGTREEAIGSDGKRMLLTLYGPSPSITRDRTKVSFMIPYTQSGSFTLYDVSGRAVWTTGRTDFRAGVNTVEVDVSGLSPGNYFVVISCESGTLSRRITRIE